MMHPQNAGSVHDTVHPGRSSSDSTNYSQSAPAAIAKESPQRGVCQDAVDCVPHDEQSVDHGITEFIPLALSEDRGLDDTEPNLPAPVHSVFPKRTRIFIIAMAAACGFISPLSGNIYFPALNALSKDLKVSSSLINVSLTTYMIVQGLTPSFMGNFSDTTGRRPAYLIGFTVYICACIGLALQTSYPALLILRCLQASGSSSTIAIASAIVADISTAAERGSYMGWVNGGALVGPALGPFIGGILAQFLGWRAIFWFLAILAGVLIIPLVLSFPETCRNVVGNGSKPPQRWNRDLLTVIGQRTKRAGTEDALHTQPQTQTQGWCAVPRTYEAPSPIPESDVDFPNPGTERCRTPTPLQLSCVRFLLQHHEQSTISLCTDVPFQRAADRAIIHPMWVRRFTRVPLETDISWTGDFDKSQSLSILRL